jgi:molybdenum cofactor cytidylyltransferase
VNPNNLDHKSCKLSEALELKTGDCIAFVGAGGKSALMLALADELATTDAKVAVTTTTKISIDEQPENGELILEKDAEDLLAKAQKAIAKGKIPVLGAGLNERGDRVLGLEPTMIDGLAGEFDYVLIEADGARRRSFKIPRAHEPPVSECVTKLCIIIGLDVIEKPVNEELFHNIDGMFALGVKPDENFSPQLCRQLMYQPDGYLRFKTENREIFLLLNKFDVYPDRDKIFELTDELFNDSINRIIVSSTNSQPFVKLIPNNSSQRITGIILAAGESKRFDGVKQLANLDGETMLGHVLTQAINSKLDNIILVLGYEKDNIIKELGELTSHEKVTVIENQNYKSGMSTSIQVGLTAAIDQADAIMIILADQPCVTTEFMDNLLDRYKYSNARLGIPIIVTSTSKRHGHPVIFSQQLFPELQSITGDHGAHDIVKKNLMYAKLLRLSDGKSQFQINNPNDLKEYLGDMK